MCPLLVGLPRGLGLTLRPSVDSRLAGWWKPLNILASAPLPPPLPLPDPPAMKASKADADKGASPMLDGRFRMAELVGFAVLSMLRREG